MSALKLVRIRCLENRVEAALHYFDPGNDRGGNIGLGRTQATLNELGFGRGEYGGRTMRALSC